MSSKIIFVFTVFCFNLRIKQNNFVQKYLTFFESYLLNRYVKYFYLFKKYFNDKDSFKKVSSLNSAIKAYEPTANKVSFSKKQYSE